MRSVIAKLFTLLFALAVASCAAPCTGHIEATVLYFKQAPQGEFVYANVLNNPQLGTQITLTRDDKEYGTFPHVVIIEDPKMAFAGKRTICFDEFAKQPVPADIDLREQNIPRLKITK